MLLPAAVRPYAADVDGTASRVRCAIALNGSKELRIQLCGSIVTVFCPFEKRSSGISLKNPPKMRRKCGRYFSIADFPPLRALADTFPLFFRSLPAIFPHFRLTILPCCGKIIRLMSARSSVG